MKKDLKQRLKSYSVAAGAVLSAGSAKAAVVYTDVNPDQTFSTNGTNYLLDLNNDNVDDFRISLSKSIYYSFSFVNVTVTPLNLNEVAVSGSYYAMALSGNAQIGAALTFAGGSAKNMAGKWRFTSSYSSFSTSYGNWRNVTDKYLGLKLKVGSNTYYGWARLDVSMTAGSFKIKDYAYDNNANQTIIAGVIPADPATSIVATDVDDNANGSDLNVAFTKAFNEATVSSYRVMVVKSASASSFGITAALAVSSANYMAITPNGSNVNTVLSSSATDVDGDFIELGQAYKIFVLSMADGVIRTIDGLSQASNAVTLNTGADKVKNILGTDVSNIGNSSDFQVSFDKVPNESRISEYRVYILKPSDIPGFNLAIAKAIPLPYYTSITPNGSNIQQTLPAFTFDVNALVISQNQPYYIYVVSMSDGVNANIDSLSGPSNEVILTNTIGIGENIIASSKVHASGNVLYLDLPETKDEITMNLFDESGKLMKVEKVNGGQNTIVTGVNPGVYLVQVQHNGIFLNQKVYLE